MSGPSVHLTVPPLSRFQTPPDPRPYALPPPTDERTFKSPFAIDPWLYNAALDWKVPVIFASCYMATVLLLNAYNRSRNNKPWWISTTRAFKVFVVIHNIALALYSAVTFAAMLRAVIHTIPEFGSNTHLADYADALCKLNGPRGLGDAATYNTTLNLWETKNKLIHLAPNGTPDPTDVGRLWGEGLAFWGWLFYLSKFYEVLDTLVILARGKRSPTLQTYHHAGAMLCMWSGMRYMSPPIWMFVFANSFIHTLMYVYFTVATLGFKVPQALKRTLTTMQIFQFVFGASFAVAHLFVKYDIPLQTSYTILHPITSAASAVSSTASSISSNFVEATATAAPLAALVKRMLLRAAGDEGVAENIRDHSGQIVMPGVQNAVEEAKHKFWEETVYRTEYTTIDCIDTSGQAFAIWLNVFYLAPLTVLFLRFFIRAYSHRTASSTPKQSKRHAALQSSVDAAKGTDRQVDDIGKAAERRLSDLNDEVAKDVQSVRDGKYAADRRNSAARKVSERVQSFERKVKERVSDAMSSPASASKNKKEQTADALENAMKNVKEESDGTRNKAKDTDVKNTDSAIKEEDDEDDRPATPSKPSKQSKPEPQTPDKKDQSMADSHLSTRSGVLIDNDVSGDESRSELDTPVHSPEKKDGNSAPGSAKKKKRKNKNKNKHHDAEHAGQSGNASFADVTGETNGDGGEKKDATKDKDKA